MADDSSSRDVVVIGGGVIGCGIARMLAPDHDVLVVDKGQVAGEASGLSAGLITPTLFHPDLPDVARYINEFYREFDGTGHFSFTERPRIELIRPSQEERARELVAEIQRNDLPVSFLEVDEVEERYPWFNMDPFVGTIEIADAGWIDPYTYTVALKEAAEAEGADIETGVTMTDLVVEDGAVAGVETDDGTFRADHVVAAAGWRTRDLVRDYVEVPVRPYRLQCVSLDLDFELPPEYPVARVSSEEVYMRPEHNGNLLAGGGEYLESRPEHVVGGIDATEEFCLHIADVVPDVVAELEEARIVDSWAGVDGCTPDSRPIIDAPADAPENLFVAAGFTGLGMVNSPVAPRAIRSMITGESCPFGLDAFAIDRFDTRSDDFELSPNAQL